MEPPAARCHSSISAALPQLPALASRNFFSLQVGLFWFISVHFTHVGGIPRNRSPPSLDATMPLSSLGSTAAAAVVRRAPAPNARAPGNPQRWVNSTPPRGARGRVPLRPGRARSPIQRHGYGLDPGLADPPRHHGAEFGVCPALRVEVSPPHPVPCFFAPSESFHNSYFIHSLTGGWTLTVHGKKFSKYLSLIINHLRQNGPDRPSLRLLTSDLHLPPPVGPALRRRPEFLRVSQRSVASGLLPLPLP